MNSLLTMAPRINKTMREDLSRAFIKDELNKTLKQMHPTKAPSPDGMPPLLFQLH